MSDTSNQEYFHKVCIFGDQLADEADSIADAWSEFAIEVRQAAHLTHANPAAMSFRIGQLVNIVRRRHAEIIAEFDLALTERPVRNES